MCEIEKEVLRYFSLEIWIEAHADRKRKRKEDDRNHSDHFSRIVIVHIPHVDCQLPIGREDAATGRTRHSLLSVLLLQMQHQLLLAPESRLPRTSSIGTRMRMMHDGDVLEQILPDRKGSVAVVAVERRLLQLRSQVILHLTHCRRRHVAAFLHAQEPFRVVLVKRCVEDARLMHI